MDITGTISKMLPIESGTSKSGNQWRRQTVVITISDGQYQKELALQLMNKKLDEYAPHLSVGLTMKFHFDASSREYNGRYYTECMIWKIEMPQAQPMAAAPRPFMPMTTSMPPTTPRAANDDDNFPF